MEEVEDEEYVEEEEEEEVKYYTIQEVLDQDDHDEWIIIEVDGKRNIYDVSNWISHHPGGDAIFKGIEANNHYMNKKLFPDSPTDLFNGIHDHKEQGALEKYLKEENQYIKFVGILK